MKNNKYKFFIILASVILSVAVFAAPGIDFNVEDITDVPDIKENISDNYSYLQGISSGINLDFEVEELLENEVNYEYIDATHNYDENDSAELFASDFSGGSGSAANPYILSTPDDLYDLAVKINGSKIKYAVAHYKLSNDIDLGGLSWAPIGFYSPEVSIPFSGTFDGNGFTISNFTIDEHYYYLGFFGFAQNATIKNLTLSDFKIDVSYSGDIWAGGLVGRLVTTGTNAVSTIDNCHIIDSEIDIDTYPRVYAGALIGYCHTSSLSTAYIKNSSVDANCTYTNKTTSSTTRSMFVIGGLVGYNGVTTNSTLEISNTYTHTPTYIYFNNASSLTPYVAVGGLCGSTVIQSDSVTTISNSFATGSIHIDSDIEQRVGGLCGQLMSSLTSNISLSNCYSTSNIYSSSSYSRDISVYASLLSSVNATDTTSTIALSDCYVLGNVVDVNSHMSLGGKIIAYADGICTLNSCYSTPLSEVIVTEDEVTTGNTSLSAEQSLILSNYVGFDEEIWAIDGDSFYPYPTLINNPHPEINYSATYLTYDYALYKHGTPTGFGQNSAKPTSTPTNNHLLFSHWSKYPHGEEFNTIYTDTVFFPNYKDEYEKVTISFYANGSVFHTQEFPYYSQVEFPTAPPKPSEGAFRYVFEYWSLSQDGEEISETDKTVYRATSYYAVYKLIDASVWDGVTKKPFQSGDGSEESPYEISGAAQLYMLSDLIKNNNEQYADKHYVLTSDVNLGNHEWQPIGDLSTPFTGTFNGNGYTVANFKITDNTKKYIGLFGYVSDALIKALEIKNADINIINEQNAGTYYIGAVAGYGHTTTEHMSLKISNCVTSGSINADVFEVYIGGIIGRARGAKQSLVAIDNSYSTVTISSVGKQYSSIGGIAGSFESTTNDNACILNCYFDGTLSSDSLISSYAAGIAGYIFDDDPDAWVSSVNDEGTEIKNCFSTASTITSSGYAGQIYAYKNLYASVSSNNYGIDDVVLTTSRLVIPPNTMPDRTSFYNHEFLSDTLLFDTNSTWTTNLDALPTLQIFNMLKDKLIINKFVINKDAGTFELNIDTSFRNHELCYVLVGAYNTKGKMIAFKSFDIQTNVLSNISVRFTDLINVDYCSVAILDYYTLELVTDPLIAK